MAECADSHSADAFWVIVPYTARIMETYDSDTGMWIKSPVISHDDTITDMSETDDLILKAYVMVLG